MKAITARDMMKRPPVTLKPEMDIEQAIKLLLKHRVSGAAVVDEGQHIIGVLSEKDCLRIFAGGAYNNLPNARVADYMTKPVATITPEADLFRVADMFLKHSFRRLPVIEDGLLVGLVSRQDVLESSRRLWEGAPAKTESDSTYIPSELRTILESK